MTNDVFDRDLVLLHELHAQPNRILYDSIVKVPVLIVSILRCMINLRRTHFNADGIVVSAIRMNIVEATNGPAMPCTILISNTVLNHI